MTDENEVILTNEEYRELLANENENSYAKGYREAIANILDEISAEVNGLHIKPVGFENEYEGGYNHAIDSVLDIIEEYKKGE